MLEIGLVPEVNLEVGHVLKHIRGYEALVSDLRLRYGPRKIGVSINLIDCVHHFSQDALPLWAGFPVPLQD